MFRLSRSSRVLPPPTARIHAGLREVQQDARSRGQQHVRLWCVGLVFICVCVCLFNSWLTPSKQTATDSSSNSSQKREQPTRTISSPTACEPRRIYTLGHLHDSYPMDHYHLEQVSGRLIPEVIGMDGSQFWDGLLLLTKPRPLLFDFVPPHPMGKVVVATRPSSEFSVCQTPGNPIVLYRIESSPTAPRGWSSAPPVYRRGR